MINDGSVPFWYAIDNCLTLSLAVMIFMCNFPKRMNNSPHPVNKFLFLRFFFKINCKVVNFSFMLYATCIFWCAFQVQSICTCIGDDRDESFN